MAIQEKKFLSPTIYPLDKDVTRAWHVKYWVKDYTQGCLVPRKLTGDINKFDTLHEREVEAQKIIDALNSGYEPKNRGARKVKAVHVSRNFSDTVTLFKEMNKELSYSVTPKTKKDYEAKLHTFHIWANATGRINYPIGQFSKSDVREFMSWLKDHEKLANKTINDYKILLGTLYEEIIDKYEIEAKNCFRRVKCLKLQTQHYKPHPLQLRLLEADKLPKFNNLLYLYMQTIFHTFARCNETRLIKRINVDFESNTITIPATDAKVSIERQCIIPTRLRELFISHGVQELPPDAYIFSLVPDHSEPVENAYMRLQWDKFRKIHDIPNIYKIYGMKHTGSKLNAKIHAAPLIQKQAGHSSLQQTQDYIDIDMNDMKIMAENFASFTG